MHAVYKRHTLNTRVIRKAESKKDAKRISQVSKKT